MTLGAFQLEKSFIQSRKVNHLGHLGIIRTFQNLTVARERIDCTGGVSNDSRPDFCTSTTLAEHGVESAKLFLTRWKGAECSVETNDHPSRVERLHPVSVTRDLGQGVRVGNLPSELHRHRQQWLSPSSPYPALSRIAHTWWVRFASNSSRRRRAALSHHDEPGIGRRL